MCALISHHLNVAHQVLKSLNLLNVVGQPDLQVAESATSANRCQGLNYLQSI